MKRLSFLEKTKELKLYTDRYSDVTLFEISQLYGAPLTAFISFILSLPLFFFGTMWISLPLCFLIIALATLQLFDERLWLLDSLKQAKIPSPQLKKVTTFITKALEQLKRLIPEAPFYERYLTLFRKLSPIVLIIAAFQVGFVQSPNTNLLSVLSMSVVSLGSFTDDGYLSLGGYFLFLLGCL